MAFPTWHEPAQLMQHALGPPDDALAGLARMLGIDACAGQRRITVIALVDDEVSRITRVNPPRPRSPRQARLLADLRVDDAELTIRTADALIRISILEERLLALRSLAPSRGDRLIRKADGLPGRIGEFVQVSSIDRLGQVWVKGAGGRPTRPQDLTRG